MKCHCAFDLQNDFDVQLCEFRSCFCLAYFMHIPAGWTRPRWWRLIFTVLFKDNGVWSLGRVQFVHGAESGVRSVIERVRDFFPQTRKPRDAAAAFPRNYCLPVTLFRTFRCRCRVCTSMSRNWNHREAVSEISEVENWSHDESTCRETICMDIVRETRRDINIQHNILWISMSREILIN